MNTPGWPSAIVTLGILAMITAITITAIVTYDLEDMLKVWAGLSAVLGVVTGAGATYFFSRPAVAAAQTAAHAAETSASAATEAASAMRSMRGA